MSQSTVVLGGMEFTFPGAPFCLGCGKAPPSGVISFAEHVHEPHCEACCKDWCAVLRVRAVLGSPHAGLADYRAWQAQRARQVS